MTHIQATIIGYTGRACTILSAYDESDNTLVIAKHLGYGTKRFKESIIITNDPKIERDTLFCEESLQEAIESYFFMSNGVAGDGRSQRLAFGDKAAQANPAQCIEKEGMNASGQRYRIAPEITNAQIATLATCWYANATLSTAMSCLDMFDSLLAIDTDYGLDDFNAGSIFTI